MLEEFELFENYLVIGERREGIRRLRVLPWENRDGGYDVEQDEPIYQATIGTNPEFASNTLRFGYSSMVTPPSVYDFDMSTQERALKKRAGGARWL